MNIVFFVILISSIYLITKNNPQDVMGVMLSGVSNSVELCLKLFAIYAIWLSVLKILEKAELDKGLAKLLKKPIGYLFSNESQEAYNYLSLNISANILGMGGAATPTGIKSMETMRHKKNKIMLVVLNATSIQLIPTTIVAMRATFASVSDIILPSLVATIFTSVLSIFLVKVFVK
jgi:spore maturation protein A